MILDPAWQFVPMRQNVANTRAADHEQAAAAPLAPGETRETVRYLFPAANTLDLQGLAPELRGESLVKAELSDRDPLGPVDARRSR